MCSSGSSHVQRRSRDIRLSIRKTTEDQAASTHLELYNTLHTHMKSAGDTLVGNSTTVAQK
jgi:hypothetical protein